MPFILHQKDSSTAARLGSLELPHGRVPTPIFMPVGTQGSVKTMHPQDLEMLGAEIILGNTYHLSLRPGSALIRQMGGLHKFSSWNRPILTDSGGFQVWSLAKLRKITEEGVRFQNHLDGAYMMLSPERSMEIQADLGSDIAMLFDECPPYPCDRKYAEASLGYTLRWARRCKAWVQEHRPRSGEGRQHHFGIVQGSVYADLRKKANIGYSHSDDIKQLYYGVSGGVLAHANGVTLGQPLNETVVLVKAPGAKDAKVENQTGVRTDWRGYAVLPYATEYRENRVALDTNTLADNVDLDNAVANVVPTRGAIVRAEFKARVGIKLLMTLTHNNKPLPFGAMVTSESSQSSGIVADNGQVYLSGMPLAGKVQVKWGEEENAHCVANYQLPPESQQQLLTQLSAECR